MFKACSGALSLALIIIVLQLFLPEVSASLIELILKVIKVLIQSIDQASGALPQ